MEQKNEDKKQMSRSNKYCMFMIVNICYNKNQKILSLYLNHVLLYLYNRG